MCARAGCLSRPVACALPSLQVARINGFEPPYANVTILCEMARPEPIRAWLMERKVRVRSVYSSCVCIAHG